MRNSQQRYGRILARLSLPLFFVILLPGCERVLYKTLYNQADILVVNRIDSIFNLNEAQSEFVTERVTILHDWHRHRELPRYAAFLQDFNGRLESGVTPADVDWMLLNGRTFRDNLYRRLYPETVGFLRLIQNPEQVAHIDAALRESNQELAEELQVGTAERLNRRHTELIDFLEDWAGDLDNDQINRIRFLNSQIPDTLPARVRYREEWRAVFVATLEKDPDARADEARRWLLETESTQPAFYRQVRYQWQQAARRMLPDILNELNAEQRATMQGNIRLLILDLRQLSVE
ncbi:MAG: hypothetical protein KDK34_20145 [Leptospiraceae bacterium]|nr:hypothetical protein [Leptospiraceae bacterium]